MQTKFIVLVGALLRRYRHGLSVEWPASKVVFPNRLLKSMMQHWNGKRQMYESLLLSQPTACMLTIAQHFWRTTALDFHSVFLQPCHWSCQCCARSVHSGLNLALIHTLLSYSALTHCYRYLTDQNFSWSPWFDNAWPLNNRTSEEQICIAQLLSDRLQLMTNIDYDIILHDHCAKRLVMTATCASLSLSSWMTWDPRTNLMIPLCNSCVLTPTPIVDYLSRK